MTSKELAKNIINTLNMEFFNKELKSLIISLLGKVLNDFEKEIRKEPNEFIKDIAKLFGEDNLGKDGISWSIDDFKNEIQETKKDQERITIDAAIDNVCRSHHISNSRLHLDIACKLIKNTKTIED